MTSRVIKLAEIRDERTANNAKDIRREMYKHIGDAVKDAGDKIAGYAVVMWDRDGFNWSTFKPGNPIRSRLVPTFVHDALQQHVTLDLAAQDRRE